MAFLRMGEDEEVWTAVSKAQTIFLLRPVQAGKTNEVLKLIEETWESSTTIFISDRNTSLAGQTNHRAKKSGWEIKDYRDFSGAIASLVRELSMSFGERRVLHFLAEVNNLETLKLALELFKFPVTLIVDEADKNKSVSPIKKADLEEDSEERTEWEGRIPPLTALLLEIKNLVRDRKGSRTIFVTATPQSLFVAERDEERLVVWKEPYKNYIGVSLGREDITSKIDFRNTICEQHQKSSHRWVYGNYEHNAYARPLAAAVRDFTNQGRWANTENITQVMLVSLEQRNAQQGGMAEFIKKVQDKLQLPNVPVMVFNGINKDEEAPTLAERISQLRDPETNPLNKVIVIAGFMAARGVSFTDFSDKDNQFELTVQVHAAKKNDPLNSAMQAMRIYGPARRTVSRPVLVCNQITFEDNLQNFNRAYEVCKQLAEGERIIYRGRYTAGRPLCQASNFRYMRPGGDSHILLYESKEPEDHKPFTGLRKI